MELGAVGIGTIHDKSASGKTRNLAQLHGCVVGVRARGIEKQNAKCVPWPAVVAEKALEAGLFDAGLLVNGSDLARGRLSRSFSQTRVIGLGPAQNGVYERRGSRPEVKRGNGPAIARFQQGLILRSGEEQFAGAIGIVVEQLDAGHQCAGSVEVGEGFGTNEIAPRIGAEMWGIDPTEYAVPKGVVALCPQQQIARFEQVLGGLCSNRP